MSTDRIGDVARLRQQVQRDPRDRVAWHNLAAAYGDLGHAALAEEAARRAVALGIDAPETRLVLARALQQLRRLDEAEREFLAALKRRGDYVDAHRDLAQLRWMRSGDAALATRELDAVLRRQPRNAALQCLRAIVLEFVGDPAGSAAAAAAGLAVAPADERLLLHAARLAARRGAGDEAVDYARRAVAAAPALAAAQTGLAEALLAAGALAEAATHIAALRRAQPHAQDLIALQATLWRLQDDPRYGELVDYARFVVARPLPVPAGFATLPAFLAALAAELERMHQFAAPPLQQSVRGGGQLTLQAAELEQPLVAALFRSIGSVVLDYLRGLGTGPDPLRSRNTGRVVFSGAWSVRLHKGGHHVDHVHPHGWLSSACHIALPPTLGQGDDDRAGWLRFGRPGVPTKPPLAADHFVQPRAGHLVLFPAYLWHGVETFSGDVPRLTVAFDVVPA